MAIFIVRTTAGRERQVVDRLVITGKKQGSIYSILNPARVKGYIFVEADNRDEVVQAVYGLGYAKGVIQKPVSMADVEHFIISAPQQITVHDGDIVELVSGPFKGEKAKVKRVNTTKEEVVVVLLDVAVPIPMTVSIDSIRVIQSEEKSESDEIKNKLKPMSDNKDKIEEFKEDF